MFAEISHVLNKIRKYSHCYYLLCTKVVEKAKSVSSTRLPKSPTISPDLAPNDFHLFPTLKVFLGGRRFKFIEMKDVVSSSYMDRRWSSMTKACKNSSHAMKSA